jgi:hypothetical protein
MPLPEVPAADVPEAVALGLPYPAEVLVEERGVEVTALPPTVLVVTPLPAAVGIEPTVGSGFEVTVGSVPGWATVEKKNPAAAMAINFIGVPSLMEKRPPSLTLETGAWTPRS